MIRDDRGFTLIELMVTLTLGLVVIGGVFNLVISSTRANKRISDRVDGSQRGRIALNSMTQELRAMVCLPDGTRPIVSATDDEVVWFANLDRDAVVDTDGDGDPVFDPTQRRLTATSTGGALTGIREDIWSRTAPAVLPASVATAPTRSRMLIDNLSPPAPGVPVFRYYGYASAASATPTLLATPVANPERIARIDVAFLARPTSGSTDDSSSSPMETSVYARTMQRDTHPGAPIPTFQCTL